MRCCHLEIGILDLNQTNADTKRFEKHKINVWILILAKQIKILNLTE